MEQEYTYYAFISYSHRDEAFAKRLHHDLEHYRMPSRLCRQNPATPKALRPIFRDGTDLAIGQLSEMLREALRTSRFIIVLCSENSVRPNADGKNWIDAEIRMFLELHREQGAAERVLPIILREEGGLSAQECLLPALRELKLPVTDVLAEGEERAMNDVIARMAGLAPEVLWERHQRERRARRRNRVLAAALTAGVAAALGWHGWDYYAPHVRYYTDYVERDNLPQGLHELTQEQAATQHGHYRFTTRKHLLRKVEHCTATGRLLEHEQEWHSERSARLLLEYGEDNAVARCVHQDFRGRQLYVCKFGADTVDFVQQVELGAVKTEVARAISHTTEGAMVAEQSGTHSAVGRHQLQRAQEGAQRGLITRELFCQMGSNHLMKDAQGISCREYKLDALGRPEAVHFRYAYRGADQALESGPTHTSAGASGYRLCYDAQGRVSNQIYFIEEQAVVIHDGRHSEKRFRYDARGRLQDIICISAEGKPKLGPDGVHRTTRRYDEEGNMVAISTFDTEGAPCCNQQGYAGRKMRYDEHGQLIQIDYFGPDGQPCHTRRGFARVRLGYDEQGNRTEIALFDSKGKPCYGREGFTRMTMRYDAQGRRTEEAFFGADGRLCTPANGVARIVWQHDELGNLIEEAYYAPDGQPCLNREGYARCSMYYDERGNRTEKEFFGVDDRPALCRDGYARVTTRYDELNSPVEESYFGSDGMPCLHRQGYATVKRRFNTFMGKDVAETFYGIDGKVCPNHEGVMEVHQSFDERGRLWQIRYSDEMLRTLNNKAGYATIQHRYNEHGLLTETSYENTNDLPACNEEGYARVTIQYDEFDQPILHSYYDEQDELAPCKAGYASVLREFDERGLVIAEAYYDAYAEPCRSVAGYAITRRQYDERGNLVEEQFFGTDGEPCPNTHGAAILKHRYDERGRRSATTALDLKGRVLP